MNILIVTGNNEIYINQTLTIRNNSNVIFGKELSQTILNRIQIDALQQHHMDLLGSYATIRPNSIYERIEMAKTKISDFNFYFDKDQVKNHDKYYTSISYQTLQQYIDRLQDLIISTNYDLIIITSPINNYTYQKILNKDFGITVQLEKQKNFIRSIKKFNPKSFVVGFSYVEDNNNIPQFYKNQIQQNGFDCMFGINNNCRIPNKITFAKNNNEDIVLTEFSDDIVNNTVKSIWNNLKK